MITLASLIHTSFCSSHFKHAQTYLQSTEYSISEAPHKRFRLGSRVVGGVKGKVEVRPHSLN